MTDNLITVIDRLGATVELPNGQEVYTKGEECYGTK